jgi:Ca2+-binding EF-hand superfamily protein
MKRILGSAVVVALFIAAPVSAQKRGRGPEAQFKRMDANGDGKIEKSEFGGKRQADATKKDKAFGRVDANNDGSISLDEFTAAAKKRAEKAPKK